MVSDASSGSAEATGETTANAANELQIRRDRLLEATLFEIPFEGWTRAALLHGAETAGMAPEEAIAAFPNGPTQIARYFSDWADRRTLEALAKHDLSNMKVRDRITLAVRLRLELLIPHKEAVRRSIALLSLPTQVGVGPELVYRTVDAMWQAAGDTATDYNFYTKRMLLAGVLSSTTLFWLQDKSVDHADSWAFLDRRIANVMWMGQKIGQTVGKGLAKLPSIDRPTLDRVAQHLPSPNRMMRLLRRRPG